jgi:serine/threonine protein kinase
MTHMLKYCMDVSKVLQFLHQRPKPIVHLDVKPENLLLDFAHPRFHRRFRNVPSVGGGGGGGGGGGNDNTPADERGLGGLPKVKLCDLGVSKVQSGTGGGGGGGGAGGVANAVVGTLMYTPPEMLHQTDTKIDGTKADVYVCSDNVWVCVCSGR